MFNKHPWIISLLLALGLGIWLASGSINGDQAGTEQASDADRQTAKHAPVAIKVRVATVHSEPVERSIVLYGRTEPNRSLNLKAEVDGRVEAILKKRGEPVKAGDAIIRIAANDRPHLLEHARAELAQRRLEYQGALSLKAKGFQGKAELARKKALMKESEAKVAALQRELRNTVVHAPFDGLLLERMVEIGDYLNVGTKLAKLVDLDPLVVRGDVTQADISQLHTGQKALVTLSNGQRHEGYIRYLSRVADEDTNTFRVEVALDNADAHIPGGLGVELQIPLETIMAVHISPALLALNKTGVIGVKWVKDNVVQFTPIDVVRSDTDGAWIRGLEEQTDIITVGQAFVREGDQVETQQGDS
ncbi:efflux RND transporter periplasmic adaptor subunit [Thiolapillus brandeum]|uniref:RND family efflux transporter MFP subunit n=1 Tax=Thiolapillus brandeum TaxID=1076588 RepID=A0A7U6GHX9_9GAMM|nr:efflux RND transporter periplasmic adaptor subunit [Thiolapillus brandeum]BAO43937.1 RND family efflux transporter MFP subunit [Thiolapillus brandeum]